ncbi:MAG: hypothetical protein ACYSW3_24655 [Planctomycetota bacterium]
MFEDKVLIWQYNCGKTRVLRRIYVKYKDNLMTLASALLYDMAVQLRQDESSSSHLCKVQR